MPDQLPYRAKSWTTSALSLGCSTNSALVDVIDQATQQHPEMRDLTVGEAIQGDGASMAWD